MRRLSLWFLGFLLIFCSVCLVSWADDAAPPVASVAITDSGEPVVIPASPIIPPATSEQVGITLANLALHYPWFALLISVMGSARLWFKPLSQLVHWWVLQTKTTADDEFVASVERSQALAWFWWVVDYIASIKRDPPGTVVTITKGSGAAALFLVGALGISSMTVGCLGVAPGSEAFVVRSEQTISSSFSTVDTFVTWEAANRDSLPESVTAVADTLRVDFPPAHNAALASIQTYKRTRSATDKDSVTTRLATLKAMADQATKAQAEISKP